MWVCELFGAPFTKSTGNNILHYFKVLLVFPQNVGIYVYSSYIPVRSTYHTYARSFLGCELQTGELRCDRVTAWPRDRGVRRYVTWLPVRHSSGGPSLPPTTRHCEYNTAATVTGEAGCWAVELLIAGWWTRPLPSHPCLYPKGPVCALCSVMCSLMNWSQLLCVPISICSSTYHLRCLL